MHKPGEVERLPEVDSNLVYLVDSLEKLNSALGQLQVALEDVTARLLGVLLSDDEEAEESDE